MTRHQLIDCTNTQSNLTLATAGGRSALKVRVLKTRLEFITKTGGRRQETFKYVGNFCSRFSISQSVRPVAYVDVTQNASYHLGLIKEFQRNARIEMRGAST